MNTDILSLTPKVMVILSEIGELIWNVHQGHIDEFFANIVYILYPGDHEHHITLPKCAQCPVSCINLCQKSWVQSGNSLCLSGVQKGVHDYSIDFLADATPPINCIYSLFSNRKQDYGTILMALLLPQPGSFLSTGSGEWTQATHWFLWTEPSHVLISFSSHFNYCVMPYGLLCVLSLKFTCFTILFKITVQHWTNYMAPVQDYF